ncbi:hypothetical protein swp_2861 [Shewanella piezotolerans WP3]|uniref:Uncharacterized protein n=1 Tax=Shewanella piezotolerans (strain WP3 / JCM 13877) TaxID=225849 RepID=B8CPL2_SHEPW|nr:hypothetical protein swp_2861 [Shewanella piezotolerans WP3]
MADEMIVFAHPQEKSPLTRPQWVHFALSPLDGHYTEYCEVNQ